MTIDPDQKARQLIAEQAARWFAALQNTNLSDAERAQFVDWIRESPVHIAEMIRVTQLNRRLANFKQWHLFAHIEERLPISLHDRETGVPRRRPPPLYKRRAVIAVAAGLLLICSFGWLLLDRLSSSQYSTTAGERRAMTLADGSTVELNANTSIVVRLRSSERLIRLVRGTVEFHVAKDSNRPFVVEAANSQVRAVGTVFDVAQDSQGLLVTVLEGRVAVSRLRQDTPSEPIVSVGAAENLSISPSGRVSAVRLAHIGPFADYPNDPLKFENQTVAEVAHLFNLHNDLQLNIGDPGLAGRRVTGIFKSNDPESFVAFLQAAAGARVTHNDATHITLDVLDSKGHARPF